MNHLYAIAGKIFFVILVMGSGVLAKKLKLISDEGEKDLSALMVDLVYPAFIFSSIVTTLTADDILSNMLLPVLSFLIHLAGYVLGRVICGLAGYSGERKKIFVLHATMNNFLAMALPFALFFFPVKGAALLAVANLGSILALWTLGVFAVAGNPGAKATIKNIFSPGLLSTIAAIPCVLFGLGAYIPALFTDALTVIGGPTMFLGLLIAGTQIYKLGWGALKCDGWNILVGLARNILVPGALFALALLLRGLLSRETLVIFMVVGVTPASVNSVTLALKFNVAPNLAAEGVVFTHVLGAGTMIGFILLVEKFFL
jgi:predicted permease